MPRRPEWTVLSDETRVRARGVEEREPVGIADILALGEGQVLAFARIKNDGVPGQVTLVWHIDGAEVAAFETEVGTSAG